MTEPPKEIGEVVGLDEDLARGIKNIELHREEYGSIQVGEIAAANIGYAAREVDSLAHMFTSEELVDGERMKARLEVAQELVGVLTSDDNSRPDRAIASLVVRAAYPVTSPDFVPEERPVREAILESAREVVSIIEGSRERIPQSDQPWYRAIAPFNNELEAEARATVLAAVVRYSMVEGLNLEAGFVTARRLQRDDPEGMGIRYTPAIMCAYAWASDIVSSRSSEIFGLGEEQVLEVINQTALSKLPSRIPSGGYTQRLTVDTWNEGQTTIR